MYEKDLKIEERFRDLVAKRVRVHQVRVFGSRARGNATAESDLDVLIVVDPIATLSNISGTTTSQNLNT